jgi:hypothetical protein
MGVAMSERLTSATVLLSVGAALLLGTAAVHAQDARNDRRDFPANGYFPGNFAAEWWAPPAAGLFGSRPEYSPHPYPSQVYFGSRCPQCSPPR